MMMYGVMIFSMIVMFSCDAGDVWSACVIFRQYRRPQRQVQPSIICSQSLVNLSASILPRVLEDGLKVRNLALCSIILRQVPYLFAIPKKFQSQH